MAKRPAFTGFDPSGVWFVDGQRGDDGSRYRTRVTVTVKDRWLEIKRDNDPNVYFGLADEKGLYFATGPVDLHLLVDGPEMNDGVWGSPTHGLGYEQFVPVSDISHHYQGQGFTPGSPKRVAFRPDGTRLGGLVEVKDQNPGPSETYTYSNMAGEGNYVGYGMLLGDRIVIADVLASVHGSYREQVNWNTVRTTSWTVDLAPADFAVAGGLLEDGRIVVKAFVAWAGGGGLRWNGQSREVWSRNQPPAS